MISTFNCKETVICASKYTAGIDLHSNNLVLAMVDKQGKRIGHQKLPCELCEVIAYLKGLKLKVVEVAVESTFN